MDVDNAFASQPGLPTPLDLSDAALAADWAEVLRDRQQRAEVLACSKCGDFARAIALLNDLLARHPDQASDYNNRGLMHFKLGHYDQARADYDRALTLNPRLDSAYNNRANCFAALGDLVSAIADYQIALDFNPGNFHAWINLGVTYRDLGEYELALDSFDFVLLLGRRHKARAYAERGRTYHLRGDWNWAIADYQRALSCLLQQRTQHRYRQQVQTWLAELQPPLTA